MTALPKSNINYESFKESNDLTWELLAKNRLDEIRKLNKAILRRNYQVEKWKEKYYMEKQLLEDSMADATRSHISLLSTQAALRKSREQKQEIYNAHFNANPITDDEEDE